VVWQSRRTAAYREAFARLKADGQLFGCACTRKEMADSGLARDGTRRYPGTCRAGLPAGREARAWRLRVPPGRIVFLDGIQGRIEEDVSADVGTSCYCAPTAFLPTTQAVVGRCGGWGDGGGPGRICSTRRRVRSCFSTCLPCPRRLTPTFLWRSTGRGETLQADAGPQRGRGAARPVLVDALAFLGRPRRGWRMAASAMSGNGPCGIGHWHGFRPAVRHRVPLMPEWHSKPCARHRGRRVDHQWTRRP
jgi:glutamyl-Q tRNA(Asp) synthetase